jgi:hypothetical protein
MVSRADLASALRGFFGAVGSSCPAFFSNCNASKLT